MSSKNSKQPSNKELARKADLSYYRDVRISVSLPTSRQYESANAFNPTLTAYSIDSPLVKPFINGISSIAGRRWVEVLSPAPPMGSSDHPSIPSQSSYVVAPDSMQYLLKCHYTDEIKAVVEQYNTLVPNPVVRSDSDQFIRQWLVISIPDEVIDKFSDTSTLEDAIAQFPDEFNFLKLYSKFMLQLKQQNNSTELSCPDKLKQIIAIFQKKGFLIHTNASTPIKSTEKNVKTTTPRGAAPPPPLKLTTPKKTAKADGETREALASISAAAAVANKKTTATTTAKKVSTPVKVSSPVKVSTPAKDSKSTKDSKPTKQKKKVVAEPADFIVEKVLAYKTGTPRGPLFLIKWLGYPSSDNTWEPFSNLSEAAKADVQQMLIDDGNTTLYNKLF